MTEAGWEQRLENLARAQERAALPFPLGRTCCGAADATACHQRGLCWMEGVHPDSPGYEASRPWRPEDGDARCQECGLPNPLWRAPNEVWNAVVGGDPSREAGGVLCPSCFCARLAPLLEAQAAVQRVEALATELDGLVDDETVDEVGRIAHAWTHRRLRRALDGTP